MKSLLVVFLTMAFYFANAQDLRVSLDGMVVFNEENITISDAGSDFAVTVESESPLYVAIIFGIFGINLLIPMHPGELKYRNQIITGTTIWFWKPFVPEME
jgi:hypothetical protein